METTKLNEIIDRSWKQATTEKRYFEVKVNSLTRQRIRVW